MRNVSSGKLLSIMIFGILAIVFFYYAIDSFVDAKLNQNGGNVPIFAGHGDNRDWVDDEWVSPHQYKRYLKGEAIQFATYAIGCVGILVYLCCGKDSTHGNEKTWTGVLDTVPGVQDGPAGSNITVAKDAINIQK